MWTNCQVYIDRKRQAERLSSKVYDFRAWYEDNFRADAEMSSFVSSG